MSLDDRRVICGYEAHDAESVRQKISERAGIPYERVWTAQRVEGVGPDAE